MSESPETRPANGGDEVDALLRDLYASISFARGQRPALSRLRQLLHVNALLVAAHGTPPRVMGPEDFIGSMEAQIESGALLAFQERELGRRSQRFGKVLHAMSAYETEMDNGAEVITSRGTNSIQLIQDDGRWWVISIVWDNETPDRPLPSGLTPADQ